MGLSITLGGGCFWCLEAYFRRIPGVVSVESGYANAHREDVDYAAVCSGESGAVEVVRLEFDPSALSLAQVLDHFFACHDPTTWHRQGYDAGPQYRSGIYYIDEQQKHEAQAAIQRAQGNWPSPIVTEVEALRRYVRAEEGHQQYFERHPDAPYCVAVIAPKLNHLGV